MNSMKHKKWEELGDSKTRALAMETVLYTSSFAGTISTILPHDHDDNGYPIPTIIFGGLPGAFHAFIVSVIFAFTCSLCALLTANKPFPSRLFFYFALIFTASAAASVVFAATSGGHGSSRLRS